MAQPSDFTVRGRLKGYNYVLNEIPTLPEFSCYVNISAKLNLPLSA